MNGIARIARLTLGTALLLLAPRSVSAQELTPAAYWPFPNRLNVLTVVNNLNWGDVTFDPGFPVEDANATINTLAFAYTRALSFFGRSANVRVQVPVVKGHLEGVYRGTLTDVDRFGLADPRVQFTANLYGAPALELREFAAHRIETIIGASVTVLVPLGQYDDTKIINLGANRWATKPEIGLTQAVGPWVLELMGGVWLFTDNTDFVGGLTRTQDPIGSFQAHVRYRFNPLIWIAANANFYTGGRTSVGGDRNLDLQRNSRAGLTLSWAINQQHSIRASFSKGAYTTIGADFAAFALGYNFGWIR